MANGVLGTSDIPATTETVVYTVPADTFSVVTLNITNRSATPRTVRVALAAAGSADTSEYIEYDVEILANGVLERTGLALEATRNIIVYADSLGCSAVVYGLETATA